MTSQSEFAATGELVGDVWYLAPSGHRYMAGQRFQDADDQEGASALNTVWGSYWVAVQPGGPRAILGFSRGIHPDRSHRRADDLLEDYPDAEVYYVRGDYREYPDGDTWLGYDGVPQTEYVNQQGYLPEWRAHVGRFAHGFDALPGFESFNQLSAAQKATAFRVGQTIGGHAWERLAFWLTYDASLSDDWKLPIVFDPVKKAVDAVCFECQSETAARRLALTINATDFAAKLAAGHIHGTDRSVNPPGSPATC